MATVYDYIEHNNRRLFLIITLFYTLILMCIWWVSYTFAVAHYSHPPDNSADYVQYTTKQIARNIVNQISIPVANQSEEISEELEWLAPDVLPAAKSFAWRTTGLVFLILLWLLIAPPEFIERMTLNAAHSHLIKMEENRELYRVAGTIFMTAGLPAPKIYIIADEALNALTVGLTANRANLVVSKGLLNKLSRAELEAVIAHEAAPVACADTRLMLISVWSVLLFGFLSELFFVGLFYGARRNILAAILLWVLAMCCAVLGFVLAPLGRLAVSRSCEMRADALAVWLCRNPNALISALRKIAKNPYVSILDNHPSMIGMCIFNPRKESNSFIELTSLYNTHPSLEKRLDALQEMNRGY